MYQLGLPRFWNYSTLSAILGCFICKHFSWLSRLDSLSHRGKILFLSPFNVLPFYHFYNLSCVWINEVDRILPLKRHSFRQLGLASASLAALRAFSCNFLARFWESTHSLLQVFLHLVHHSPGTSFTWVFVFISLTNKTRVEQDSSRNDSDGLTQQMTVCMHFQRVKTKEYSFIVQTAQSWSYCNLCCVFLLHTPRPATFRLLDAYVR